MIMNNSDIAFLKIPNSTTPPTPAMPDGKYANALKKNRQKSRVSKSSDGFKENQTVIQDEL